MFKMGNELAPHVQRKALAQFVHRFTRDHVPTWACDPMSNGQPYPVQFDSDADWLANTEFQVTKSGELDKRAKWCRSSPTWPDNPEHRKAA